MATHIVLLRGVNVGGNNKVPMAILRTRLEADGFTRVRTYIQSGNVLVDAPGTAAKAGARVGASILDEFGVDVPVVALGVTALRTVVDQNPYAAETDHKNLHAMFLPAVPDAVALERLAELNARFAGDLGDSTTLLGSTLYIHTPGGFGNSDLAKALSSKGRLAALNGTARNWATVTTLLAMASE